MGPAVNARRRRSPPETQPTTDVECPSCGTDIGDGDFIVPEGRSTFSETCPSCGVHLEFEVELTVAVEARRGEAA